MPEYAIEVEDLAKSYGDVQAVRGVTFSVARGSLFSFLGVNGAGKSTTINILCSILRKDAGRVRIGGMDLDEEPEKIKPRVGVVFQNTVLDDLLTVRENLAVRASYYGLRGRLWKARLEELTEMLGLGELLSRPFGKLSGGQRRRVDIARGLINRPALLVLDEPTTGLDPQTRKTVWETIKALRREQNMTVFLTTHYMEEADGADRVVIIDGGRIVADDTPAELKNAYSRSYLYLHGIRLAAAQSAANGTYSFEETPGGVRASMPNAAAAQKFLREHPDLCGDFEYVKGNMDDVFLAVTGKSLPEGGNA